MKNGIFPLVLFVLVNCPSVSQAGDVRQIIPSDPTTGTAKLKNPFGVDFDSKGRMWIVELGGGRVHQWTARNGLNHVSGNGQKGYSGDGKPMSQAVYDGMHNLAITKSDDILIADSWNHCVRKIDGTTGMVSTIAGNGKAGFSGDGGPAKNATFNFIMCIALTPDESGLLITDLKNRRIRLVDMKTSIVETVAGNGTKGVPLDNAIAIEQPLVDPRAATMDSKKNIYVLERGGHALRMVTPAGRISSVAGTGKAGFKDGPALESKFGAPKHLCVDQNDRVVIADDNNAAIRLYDPKTNAVSTLLGRGFGDKSIKLKRPHGVTVHEGKLYVVDSWNDRVLGMDHN